MVCSRTLRFCFVERFALYMSYPLSLLKMTSSVQACVFCHNLLFLYLHASDLLSKNSVSICKCAWMCSCIILRASLSNTFLQTLPELIDTPLKGHSLSPCSWSLTLSAPSKKTGYKKDCGNNIVLKHPHKHEAHLPQVEKVFGLDSNNFVFLCVCMLA